MNPELKADGKVRFIKLVSVTFFVFVEDVRKSLKKCNKIKNKLLILSIIFGILVRVDYSLR